MKRFSGLIELFALTVAALILVFFVGTPSGETAASVQSPPTRLGQGTPLWDDNLVLPDTSERIVHYTMDVKLDAKTNVIRGSEVLEWRNTTGQPQRSFPFHLYHNAWKNNRSTFAKEIGWRLRWDMDPSDYGWTNILSASVLTTRGDVNILPSFRYLQPDDANPDDQTVCELSTPDEVPPGGMLRIRLEFETKQPKPIARTGAVRNYHFVAQWFPKIGVWWNGSWNCHQFHSTTEFFADYGVYDVKITVPHSYIVGASGGIAKSIETNSDSTTTHRFVQADIHDFAWVTSPDLNVSVRTFSHSRPNPNERSDRHHPLRDVTVILLWQPQHENVVDRYFDATFKALRFYGEWYGQYPYDAVTVVDPANGSASGGMEYPTLFTGGTSMFTSRAEASPEGVTVHEFGHQFWYALVGNNEFEEAWLDEGFNTYSTDRTIRYGWEPFKAVRHYFGIPWVFDGIQEEGLTADNTYLRQMGKNDVMAKRGWEYNQTYGLNSYTKPAMSLMTLERYLGEELMYRVMRTYHHRFRFKHPTSADFIRTVDEVTGRDYRWFFDNTWYSSDLFDYSVDRINNMPVSPPAGAFGINGAHDTSRTAVSGRYVCEVVVKREGEAIAPVTVAISFRDGTQRLEMWDGHDRWTKFSFFSNTPVERVVVDPDHKLVMDVNWNNNSRVERPPGFRSLAARKYAVGVLFWLQTYFEFMSFGN